MNFIQKKQRVKKHLWAHLIMLRVGIVFLFAFFFVLSVSFTPFPRQSGNYGSSFFQSALAGCNCGCSRCAPLLAECNSSCIETSETETSQTNEYIDEQFVLHRKWMVDVLFLRHLLPAMMLMTEQLSAAAMGQVEAIGMMLDAKHQLETQRLFQEMTAQAHKDYQPSEGMCTFGTTVRSLAASERSTELSAAAFSSFMTQREMLSGDSIAGGGRTSDFLSRLRQFRDVYCNPADNGNGLSALCPSTPQPQRLNLDIDYSRTVESPLTLDVDFTNAPPIGGEPSTISANEQDILALSANLYAHDVAPVIPAALMSDKDGNIRPDGVKAYLDIRSISAKRSVARNTFAAITGMKTKGSADVQPYLFAIMKEFGLADQEGIKAYLGDRPSYYAQMEILTKKLYQDPKFYTELYDKPANVARKKVAMQAIELMQRRDMYRSLLRSEAILSVMLETALLPEQEKVTNEMSRFTNQTELINPDTLE